MNAPIVTPLRPLARLEADLIDSRIGVTQHTYRFLILLREFDLRQGWSEWGSADCADWLNWKCGINRNTAREKLRTARALYDLPQIEEAFKRGDLSYSKVRALSRIATPVNETDLLDYALGATAAQVEGYCRRRRNGDSRVSTEEARRVLEQRALYRSRRKDGGGSISVESVRRLCCDGSLIPIVTSESGEPLSVGRKLRSVPTGIRRALATRDGGCCYPGCTHERWIDAHHIRHWADGGETSLENLMLLCTHHHRPVHEGGFRIRQHTQGGGHYFVRTDGRPVETPASVSAETQIAGEAMPGRGCASVRCADSAT